MSTTSLARCDAGTLAFTRSIELFARRRTQLKRDIAPLHATAHRQRRTSPCRNRTPTHASAVSLLGEPEQAACASWPALLSVVFAKASDSIPPRTPSSAECARTHRRYRPAAHVRSSDQTSEQSRERPCAALSSIGDEIYTWPQARTVLQARDLGLLRCPDVAFVRRRSPLRTHTTEQLLSDGDRAQGSTALLTSEHPFWARRHTHAMRKDNRQHRHRFTNPCRLLAHVGAWSLAQHWQRWRQRSVARRSAVAAFCRAPARQPSNCRRRRRRRRRRRCCRQAATTSGGGAGTVVVGVGIVGDDKPGSGGALIGGGGAPVGGGGGGGGVASSAVRDFFRSVLASCGDDGGAGTLPSSSASARISAGPSDLRCFLSRVALVAPTAGDVDNALPPADGASSDASGASCDATTLGTTDGRLIAGIEPVNERPMTLLSPAFCRVEQHAQYIGHILVIKCCRRRRRRCRRRRRRRR